MLTAQEIDEMLDAPGNFAYVLADKRGRAHLFARAIEQAATAPLLSALHQIAEWPDGGNRYGQENIKRFAQATIDAAIEGHEARTAERMHGIGEKMP